MNTRFVLGLILSIMVLSLGLSAIVSAATSTIQVISPQNGQTFYYGQQVVVVAKYVPNASYSIGIINPVGTYIPITAGAFGPNGYINVTIGKFGVYPFNLPGEYKIQIEANGGQGSAIVTIYYKPFVATIVAQVQNEQHLPLSGATVYLYNVTAGMHELIATETTNATGIAVFQVIAYNFTQQFQVVASMPGYVNSSATVSVYENQTKTVTLTLYPAVLNVYVVAATQNGMTIAPLNPSGYTSLVATEGSNITVYIETEFAGKPVTNATVTVIVTTPTGTSTYTATPVTSGPYAGYYMVTFMLPAMNVSYDALMNIIATYSSLTTTIYVPIAAQVNYTALVTQYVSQLHNEIEALNSTVYVLLSEIKSLNTSISSLASELSSISSEASSLESTVSSLKSSISSLNSTVSSLSSEVSSLNSQVSSLSSQVSSLNSKLSSITPMVYAGLAAGIIGLIIAIVAIVLVYRKIS